jgi:hypothetical protein
MVEETGGPKENVFKLLRNCSILLEHEVLNIFDFLFHILIVFLIFKLQVYDWM